MARSTRLYQLVSSSSRKLLKKLQPAHSVASRNNIYSKCVMSVIQIKSHINIDGYIDGMAYILYYITLYPYPRQPWKYLPDRRRQSFRPVSWKSAGDCMRNANKSLKSPILQWRWKWKSDPESVSYKTGSLNYFSCIPMYSIAVRMRTVPLCACALGTRVHYN